MGYGQLVILLEGDHTSNVNRIIEMFDSRDASDLFEEEDFIHAYKTLKSKYITRLRKYQNQPDRMGQYYFIVGFHKGWTVINQIEPTRCDKERCLQISSQINGKVVCLGIETHVNYYEVIMCDKGQTFLHVKSDDCRLIKNEGMPYDLDIVNGEPDFGPGDVYRITEGITGIDVDDLIVMRKKEKIEKVSVKLAFKRKRLPEKTENKKTSEILDKQKPDSAEAYYNLGMEYKKIFYYYDASKAYANAVKLNPGYFEAYYHLGIVYSTLCLFKKAIQAFDSAIEIIQKHMEAGQSGVTCINSPDMRPSDGRHPIELKPYLAAIYYDKGMVYFNDHSWDEAADTFKEAIRLKPDFEKAYHYIGIAYRNLEAYADAVEAFKAVIRLNPENTSAYSMAGDALLKLGSYDEAIRMLTETVHRNPEAWDVYLALGNTYFNKGSYGDAIEAYRKAVGLKPIEGEQYILLGLAYEKAGSDDEARNAFITAAWYMPLNPQAHYHSGVAQYKAGLYNDAIKACTRAAQLKPDHAEAYYYLGLAYDATGAIADAIKAFQKAVEVSPEGSAIIDILPSKYKPYVHLT